MERIDVVLAQGAAANELRTPKLVRLYLSGQTAFPGDDPEAMARRQAQGDYTASIHRSIKALLKAEGLRQERRLRYPRKHTFQTLVKMLEHLGLVEPTGETGPPEGPSAGILGDGWDFHQRRWLRLTPGAETDPAWNDPVGHYLVQYPETFAKMRPNGIATMPAAPRRTGRDEAQSREPEAEKILAPAQAETRAPSRPRSRVVEVPVPAAALPLAELTRAYQSLLQSAQNAAVQGSQIEDFEVVVFLGKDFQEKIKRAFPRAAFAAFDEALDIQARCFDILRETGADLTQRRQRAVAYCRSSAERLARDMVRVHPVTLAALAAPTAGPATAAAPSVIVPELRLPEKITARAIQRLTAHLEKLEAIALEAPVADMARAIYRLVPQIADWETELSDKIGESESERSIERWEAQQSVLEEVREKLEEANPEAIEEELSSGRLEQEDVPGDIQMTLKDALDSLSDWE